MGNFSFGQIETVPTEQNKAMLVSLAGKEGRPARELASYSQYEWYTNSVQTGVVRGGDTDILGYGININNERALNLFPNGTLDVAKIDLKDYSNFDSHYKETINLAKNALNKNSGGEIQQPVTFYGTKNGTGAISVFTRSDDNNIGDALTYLGYNHGTPSKPEFSHYLRGQGITNIDTLGGCYVREGLQVGRQVVPGDYGNFDGRYIQLNTNTKTTGYILSKAANYVEDTNSRNLGLSGFLRPNEGLEGLGALAIHIAHPNEQSAQHARGISFSYGGYSGYFRLSTYAFDDQGNFRGSKRILTEEDINPLTNIPVGVPLPWSHTAPPEGYFECNGQQFDKSQYPKLAMAYPSGTVPDLRGEFVRGLDNGRGADPNRGILTHQEGTIISGLDDNDTGDISFVGSPGVVFGDPMTDAQWASIKGKKWISSPNLSQRYDWWAYVSARPRNVAFIYIVRAA
ncbi:phage tail protein [Xenorhabdus bovienii]|uniref:phage tail protein n=1 Tax=Xenorhabdus bovienii TaxID=40576 RepID=UPI0023B256F0|nr:phage tail protein [Xenorhabdus bovienii]